jgi:hypothetical protein
MAAPVPPVNAAALANMVKLVIGGTAAAWGISNSLFNVEGGHRAIVFNRLVGIKETVRGFSSGCVGFVMCVRRCVLLLFWCCVHAVCGCTHISTQCARDKQCSSKHTKYHYPPTPPNQQIYQEGTHLMVPWFDRPIIYDVRARPSLISSTSGSRDLQMVNIGLRVLTRPNPEKLPQLYRCVWTAVVCDAAAAGSSSPVDCCCCSW